MDTPARTDDVYAFGEFRLDTRRHLLFAGPAAEAVPLSSKAFEALTYLVQHRDQVVEKSELMRAVWPNTVVEENNLNQVITALRRVFGERRSEHRFIVTIPGRGYRFVADVRSEGGDASGARPPSIAVLPFANLTGEPDKDYLGDGIAEELIHALARVPGLRVPARTSSFAYKGRSAHIRDIAHDLNVATVLEGSVRSARERIRVTVQLIDASSGYHVWSQSFDRRCDDIFELQDELAGAIVSAVSGEPSAPRTVTAAPPTRDVEAYHLYLQGMALYGRPSIENYLRAAELFVQAIARDPRFARAICAEAGAHWALAAYYSAGSLDAALTKSDAGARRALALEPDLADAEALLGSVCAQRLQWVQAEAHYRRSLALEDNVLARIAHAFLLTAATGHLQQGRQQLERAFEQAPAEPNVPLMLATFYSFEGRDADALRLGALAEALGWPTEQVPLPIIRSQAARRDGRYREAGEYMKQSFPEAARRGGADALVELIYAALEDPLRKDAAIAAIRGLMAERGNEVMTTSSFPMLLMHWAVTLGDVDLAFEIGTRFLDVCERERALPVSSFLPQLWVPEMRPFRGDPRFHVFAAERLKLSDFWTEYGPPDS